MSATAWLSAAEAARVLGIRRATLYAYVSRGYIRSQATAGPARDRQYARDDVERLRRRVEERRDPQKAAARALAWGVPVLESSITAIDGTRLYYRGHDALALAQTRSVEQVAALIWMGRLDAVVPADAGLGDDGTDAPPLRLTAGPAAPGGGRPSAPRDRSGMALSGVLRGLPFTARAHILLAAAAVHDPLAYDLRPQAVAPTGWRILHLMTQAAGGRSRAGMSIDAALAREWRVGRRGVDVLRQALILCADHELNVSSFTARCVASAGASPYAVVSAGLAALEGTRHGGTTTRVEAMLAELRRRRPISGALADRLRRGERLDGFGHPLYTDGDPRAAALLDLLRERYPRSPEVRFVAEVLRTLRGARRERPNLDFALASVARVLRLPPESGLTLFAIGRTIGWIGHAIEQYATGQLIRPRAKYVGVPPQPTSST